MSIRTVAAATAIAVGVAGLGLTIQAQTAPPDRLGLAESEAQHDTMESFETGTPVYGLAAYTFLALPPAARAAVVHAGFAWIKAYVNSPAFKAAFATARENRKPTPPQFKGSVDDELKAKQAEQVKSLADAKAMMASLPASAQAQMADTLKQAEARINDPKMIALMRQNIEAERAGAERDYEADLKKWEQEAPVDPMILVARRLHEFLDVCSTVDFSAKLVGSGRNARFASADDEGKPDQWKRCFRAGPEAVAAARAEAQAWLKQLPQ